MNQIYKKIISFSTILVLIFSGIASFPQSSSADECSITKVTISPNTEPGTYDGGFYSAAVAPNKPVSITVITKGCEPNRTIYVTLYEANSGMSVPALTKKAVASATGALRITMQPGEEQCSAPSTSANCYYRVRAGLTATNYDYDTNKKIDGQLRYDCEGLTCGDKWIYNGVVQIPNPNDNPYKVKEGCEITKASINPHTNPGDKDPNFYHEESRQSNLVTITVNSKGCEGEKIFVSLTQYSWGISGSPTNGFGVSEELNSIDQYIHPNVSALNHRPFISSTGSFKITMIPGQDLCRINAVGADCNYSVRVGVNPETYKLQTRDYSYENGRLDYDCEGVTTCDGKSKWEFKSFQEIPAPVEDEEENKADVFNDKNISDDPCSKEGTDCYTLYSGFSNALDRAGGKFTAISTADSIGGFINAIIAFGIGLGGILAVVMIMYEGFLYMKSDNVNTKTTAKSRIINTVIGFLLLLSIYTLLRTINPDLLGVNPQIDYTKVDSGENGDGSPEDAVTTDDTSASGPATSEACKAGIVTTQGIRICKDLSKGLDDMFTAAKQANITLTGSGWRSSDGQIKLRIKNCGGDNQYNIYKKPSGDCNPETAIPGKSRHEQGLAVDLKCSGIQINRSASPATATCFNWLSANAAKYGFKNLKSSTRKEDWHWSSDGH